MDRLTDRVDMTLIVLDRPKNLKPNKHIIQDYLFAVLYSVFSTIYGVAQNTIYILGQKRNNAGKLF